MKKNQIFCFYLVFVFSFSKVSFSEPFVVLEYRGNLERGNLNSDSSLLKDLDYSAKHVVLKNQTESPADLSNSWPAFPKYSSTKRSVASW